MRNADLSRADLRDAEEFVSDSTTRTRSTIWPEGDIRGLQLDSGDTLTVRGTSDPHDGHRDVITVTDRMVIDDGGTLDLVRLSWGPGLGFVTSTPDLTLDPGILIELGGTLRISGVVPQIGETLDLFDWGQSLAADNVFSNVEPFDDDELPPGAAWDLSRLYSTGEITLLPEPGGRPMRILACNRTDPILPEAIRPVHSTIERADLGEAHQASEAWMNSALGRLLRGGEHRGSRAHSD